MILLNRLNGPPVALNCDLLERAEATPDTVLTLIDGTKYLVRESVEQVIDEVRRFRASVIALADRIADEPATPSPSLRVVRSSDEG